MHHPTQNTDSTLVCAPQQQSSFTFTMDETDLHSHLRANREDYHYAQQAHSTHRAAEGVERVEPLNEPWQALQGQGQGQGQGQRQGQSQSYAGGQQYNPQQTNSYPQDQSAHSPVYLSHQYQGQDTSGQFQPQGYIQYSAPNQQGYQQPGHPQANYADGQHAQYQGPQGVPPNVPHSMTPPPGPQYPSHPYHHGQPPGAHMNQNTFTASHENALHHKLQDMHIIPGGKESNDPGQVTEKLAQQNVNGEKTMVPPNPKQYPPLLQPMQPHLQLM